MKCSSSVTFFVTWSSSSKYQGDFIRKFSSCFARERRNSATEKYSTAALDVENPLVTRPETCLLRELLVVTTNKSTSCILPFFLPFYLIKMCVFIKNTITHPHNKKIKIKYSFFQFNIEQLGKLRHYPVNTFYCDDITWRLHVM